MYGYKCKRYWSQTIDEFNLLPSIMSEFICSTNPYMPKTLWRMSTACKDDNAISLKAISFNIWCQFWWVYLIEKHNIDTPMEYTCNQPLRINWPLKGNPNSTNIDGEKKWDISLHQFSYRRYKQKNDRQRGMPSNTAHPPSFYTPSPTHVITRTNRSPIMLR